MFYRYEAKTKEGKYKGIFSFFNPSQRRYFNRFVKEPKWYEENPDVSSKCWFTEEGYEKYHEIIENFIYENRIRDFRLLKKSNLTNVVCQGKIQCIQTIKEM
jgi:hypothetical protein